jgi:NADPH:quinone reductase-like Zn-dependent oxidoreductase
MRMANSTVRRCGQRRTLPEIAARLALKTLSAVPQSEMPISGKTVLITGATSGLGLATAMLLAERGAEVVMVGRDRTRCRREGSAVPDVSKNAASSGP